MNFGVSQLRPKKMRFFKHQSTPLKPSKEQTAQVLLVTGGYRTWPNIFSSTEVMFAEKQFYYRNLIIVAFSSASYNIVVRDKQIEPLVQPGGRLLRWLPACLEGGGGRRASITEIRSTSHRGRRQSLLVRRVDW